jgi:hypothetical protein
MGNAWRQRAEMEMQRLIPPAQAIGLWGLQRDGLRLAAVQGAFIPSGEISLDAHPELQEALRRTKPWVCDDSERWLSLLEDGRSPLASIWWPLQGQGVSLGFLVVFGDELERSASFLARLSGVAGHLTQGLLRRLDRSRHPGFNTPFGERSGNYDTGWPSDPNRRLGKFLDDPMPTGGAAVRDASMVLQLALENPDGAAAQTLARLDDLLITPLTKRFLDTGLEAILPLMERLPKSRQRVLKLMINADDAQIRHDALHCLERWPNPSMAREVLPLAFSADHGVATAAARVLERCRNHDSFNEDVLKELRSLVGDDRAGHAHRRALDLLIRFRDADAVPLLITRLDDHPLNDLAARGLTEITLIQSRWGRPAWQSWYAKHAHEPRTLWLLEALDHRDMEVRSQAIAELYGETGKNFGYDPSAPSRQRKVAIGRARQTITPVAIDATP